MAVVDTNVLAYLLLGTEPFRAEVGDFWRQASDVIAPDSWRCELANVLWMAVRAEVITQDGAQRRFRRAERLIGRTESARPLRAPAIGVAVREDHPVYDTLFVVLARREGLPLATFDRRLLDRFPDVAVRPGQLASQR
jgi:predicted nucleic acid-binding protein